MPGSSCYSDGRPLTGFRHIVAGLDCASDSASHDQRSGALSPGSQLVLDQVRWLARARGTRVSLVHSTAGDEHWDVGERGFVRVRAGESSALASLDAALEALRADGVDGTLAVSDEPAALAIIQLVLREGADLVVVAKRGHHHHDGRLLGSVSTKLLRKAPCAVWVAKPGSTAEPRTVLAATDLTDVGERVVRVAAAVAEQSAAELHVVHSFQMPLDVQLEGDRAQEEYAKRASEESSAAIASQLRGTRAGENARLHIGLTSPTHAILECEARFHPDLVVMGTVSRGGIAGLLVGNTAERLIGRLDCSLLAVKPADFVCPIAAA